MRSVTSHGTRHGRFQRAIEGGNLLAAETAARELGYERAALRWHGRLELEAKRLAAERREALAAEAISDRDKIARALGKVPQSQWDRLVAATFEDAANGNAAERRGAVQALARCSIRHTVVLPHPIPPWMTLGTSPS